MIKATANALFVGAGQVPVPLKVSFAWRHHHDDAVTRRVPRHDRAGTRELRITRP